MTLIEVDHESKIIDLKTEPGDILDGSKDNVQDEDNDDLDEDEIDFEGKIHIHKATTSYIFIKYMLLLLHAMLQAMLQATGY